MDRTQRAGKRTSLTEHLAPSIVRIRYHFGAVAVKQTNNIALQVVQVGVGSTVEDHHSRLVLRIVEEVQLIAIFGHMHNVLAMQGVAGRLVANVARGVIIVHAGLLGAQSVFAVIVGDLIVAGFTKVPLMHAAQPATVDPRIVPGAVVGGIANGVIGNGLAVERSQLVLPVGVAIGKEIRLYSRTHGAGASSCCRHTTYKSAWRMSISPWQTSTTTAPIWIASCR